MVDILSCVEVHIAMDDEAYSEFVANMSDHCSWKASPKHVIPI